MPVPQPWLKKRSRLERPIIRPAIPQMPATSYAQVSLSQPRIVHLNRQVTTFQIQRMCIRLLRPWTPLFHQISAQISHVANKCRTICTSREVRKIRRKISQCRETSTKECLCPGILAHRLVTHQVRASRHRKVAALDTCKVHFLIIQRLLQRQTSTHTS